MSDSQNVLGRRKLLVLGAGAAAIPACSGANSGPGGPYGWDPWAPDASGGGSSGSPGGSSSGESSSGGSTSGGPGGSSSSSGGSSSGVGGSSSGGSSSSSSGNTSSSSSGSSTSSSSSGSSTSSSSSGGVTTCTPTGKLLSLTFAQYPALMNSGGTATLTASGYSDPNCGKNQIIVINQGSGKFVALSTSCTHACCAVSYTGSGFRCPCHGATFDATGKSTSFIAPGSLPSLPVCADATAVHVTIG